MSKKEFNDLINYMRNRPGERDRLIEALGLGQASPEEGISIASKTQPCKSITWVTVRQAGEAIGRSGKWVREHMHLFPSAMKTREGRGSWRYLLQLDEVTAQYEHYLYMQRL